MLAAAFRPVVHLYTDQSARCFSAVGFMTRCFKRLRGTSTMQTLRCDPKVGPWRSCFNGASSVPGERLLAHLPGSCQGRVAIFEASSPPTLSSPKFERGGRVERSWGEMPQEARKRGSFLTLAYRPCWRRRVVSAGPAASPESLEDEIAVKGGALGLGFPGF